MFIPEKLDALAKRKEDPDAKTPSTTTRIISLVCAGVVAFFLTCTIVYYGLRHMRRRHSEPTYLPTDYLKNKWRNWKPKHWSVRDGTHLEPMTGRMRDRTFCSQPTRSGAGGRGVHFSQSTQDVSTTQNTGGAEGGVDRNASVRTNATVKTLPEYTEIPRIDETAWREGERAGMDSVVQLPDEAAIEEERREEEMEAQYQLRLARQNVRDGREVRRVARESGDAVRIAEAQRERNRRAEREELERLRTEHETVRKRPRAVSKVEYGNVGLVAAGGRRIRANSEESNRPLLDNAGGMAEDDADLGAQSIPPPNYDDYSGQPSPAYTPPTQERQNAENSFYSAPGEGPSPQPSPGRQASGSQRQTSGPQIRQLTPPPQFPSTGELVLELPYISPSAGLGLDFEDVSITSPDNDMPSGVAGSQNNGMSRTPSPNGSSRPIVSKKESERRTDAETPPRHVDMTVRQLSYPPVLSPGSKDGWNESPPPPARLAKLGRGSR